MVGFIDLLAEMSKAALSEGCYEEGGLLYCGKCKTPRQCRITICGTERVVFCLCKCEIEKDQAEKDELSRRDRNEKIRRLKSVGFPDADLLKWNFSADDGKNKRLSNITKRYVEEFGQVKKGLILHGAVGVGKTFYAACIANALVEKGVSVLMTNFTRLTNQITATKDKQAVIDGINEFDLLVIDDLAAERNTEFMSEIVFTIIDSRYRCGKPVIITTNLSADELINPTDTNKQRIYSRLIEMCYLVEVKGEDRRKQNMIERI